MAENDVVYVSPDELRNQVEQVSEIESDDYVGGFLIPVGSYLSQSRDIKVAEKKGFLSLEISFPNGIQNEGGNTFGGGQYPLRTWVSNRPYPEREGQAGSTSSMAEYFKAVGFNPKELRTKEDVFDAIRDSQGLPVKVFIGWTNKTEKLPDGTYSKEFAKTKDFNTGTKEEPSYVPFFIKDGSKVEAKHKVAGFRKV